MTTQLDSIDPVAPIDNVMSQSTTSAYYKSIDETSSPTGNVQLPLMIDNLQDKVLSIVNRIALIQRLNQCDEFKILSKSTRNNLLHGLQDEISDLEEIAKSAVRALKKVKRERISEEKVDQLLNVPDYIRNAITQEES